MKNGVKSRACEDRLCEECFTKNEAALREGDNKRAQMSEKILDLTRTGAMCSLLLPVTAPVVLMFMELTKATTNVAYVQ